MFYIYLLDPARRLGSQLVYVVFVQVRLKHLLNCGDPELELYKELDPF